MAHATDPLHVRIDDIARALDCHPRLSGLVFRSERWEVAASIWNLTAMPAHQHGPALRELAETLAPHDPTVMDPLCAAYRRAILRWGGQEPNRRAG